MTTKSAVYNEVARLVKALAHPSRLEIIEMLVQRTWSVDELASALGMPIGKCSRHLQILKDARLVSTDRSAQFIHYSLADDAVADVHTALIRLATARLAEVERLMRGDADAADVPSVTSDTLKSMVRRRRVVLLDVRARDEFDAAHLKDAVSIPLDDLASAYRKLPKDRPVVAYCRGPVCLLAVDAVRFLRSKGFDAYRYEETVRDGKAAGLPVEST